MKESQHPLSTMSSPTVHFNDSTSQIILITDLNPSTPSSTNDALEDGEVLRPPIDLKMSAKILELSKVPIVDPQSSLTLINNWKDRLSDEAVAALAQNIARSAVGKLRHAIDHEDRHKAFVTSLRKEQDDTQERIDQALAVAEATWDRRLAETLASQEAEHHVSLDAIRAGSQATVEDLQHRLHQYEAANAVECPEGFEENRGLVPHFPIVIDRFTLQARYIKYINQGRVMGTAGGPNDAIFIQDLYATFRIDNDHVPEPLPAWFLRHIQANSDTYPSSLKRFWMQRTGEFMPMSNSTIAATLISALSRRRLPPCKPSLPPQLIMAATAMTLPPNPSATSGLTTSPVVGLQSNRRVMTPAVLSGCRVVDGYVRVGPNWWSRRSDVSGV